ncbi:MAG TPA: polysaccharide deacetylase family protein, partial [Hyphomicrobiaceae bacterium]|nr:polysaccharide deacetylase family protein [Hyphomicrobiaceae bacterium]
GLSAVQQAMGKPIAPFFRFPYLRDNAFTVSHLQKRQIADFGINIDSRDFQIRDAETLHKRVIEEISARRRGIVLFHDIHISTARAIPAILADIKKLGLRIVHLQPKAGAETLAEYDALARKALERRHIVAARNPLSKRAVAWPLAPMPAKTAAAPPAAAEPPPALHATKPEENWMSHVWDQTN